MRIPGRVFAFALSALGGGGVVALAQSAPGSELAWRMTRTFPNGERPTEVVEGLGVVQLDDGSYGDVDPELLIDADGRSYVMEGGAGQDAPGDPLVATVEIRPSGEVILTEAELEAELLAREPTTDLDAYRARRARPPIVSAPPTHVAPELAAWAATSSGNREVVVVLRAEVPLDVPASGLGIDNSVEVDLALQEDRLLALQKHRTDVEATQLELIAAVEAAGGEITGRSWLVNRLHARVTPGLIDALALRSDVARIEVPAVYGDDTNTGDVIRHKLQVQQFLDEGLDGSVASGRSAATNILVGVIDTVFDEDHPGWEDRVYAWKKYNTATTQWDVIPLSAANSASASTPNQHGGLVVSALLADLTQGQDPTLTTLEGEERTGTTPESSLVFYESGEPITVSRENGMDGAAEDELDVVNMSRSCSSCTFCDTDDSENAYVDSLYHLGTFVVNTPGNTYVDDGSCYVSLPGTAAGSFTPGALVHTAADLHTADLTGGSPGGTDVHGRTMIDLVAPAGRQGATHLYFDDSYTTGGSGTSVAAPHIAGAAANLKHQLIDLFGTSTANVVGNLYAQMLLMGDRATGPTSFGASIDRRWGAGRMRMRMWDVEGMDAPHRMRFGNFVLSDGGSAVIPVNPDGSGINQAIPAAADRLKVAVWWFEPNVGSTEAPADIGSSIRRPGIVVAYTSAIAAQRHQADGSVGGNTWELHFTGFDIPASTDPDDPLYLEQKRKVHWALYYEDRGRDDVEGPDCCDEIDIDYATCCAQTGSNCPSVCP